MGCSDDDFHVRWFDRHRQASENLRKQVIIMHKKVHTPFIICALALNVFNAIAEPVPDRITVTVRRSGPDVLLIPGLTCSSAVWDATAKRLEGHYRLHLVQVAGFAGSPPRANAKGPILQPTVSALDAYIKTSKLNKPAVIGHSMGGLMGMTIALQHPEDTGKLMIVDSLPFFSVLMGAKDAAAAEAQAAAMRDTILTETQEDYAQGERQFLRFLVKSPEGLKAATQWAIASDKAVVARATYELMTTDLRPKLREIKTPITMLYPWDPASGFAQAATDRLYEGNFAPLPNKTLVRIPNSFHFIMLDQPEAFAAQVDAFLK
jgi:pimeloyl-ACP methyl ester carboxylesterase